MTAILAIDPGSARSAWVNVTPSGAVQELGIDLNEALPLLIIQAGLSGMVVVIERIEPRYGLNMGWETIETCEWVGRFVQASGGSAELLRRSKILSHFDVARAKGKADVGIRAALMDRYGGSQSIRKGGPLYGVKADIWAALSVACAYADGLRAEP